MSDQIPTNIEVVSKDDVGGFTVDWFLYFERLKDAKVTEDFASLPTLTDTSTLDDLRAYLIALDVILKG